MKAALIAAAAGMKPPSFPKRSCAPCPGVGEGAAGGGHGSVVAPRLSIPAFCKKTRSHLCCSLAPQRPQTKTKPPQAAGPSSPQRPKMPEETKPASPGPQEDTDTDGEHSGQSLRVWAWTPGSEGEEGWKPRLLHLREVGLDPRQWIWGREGGGSQITGSGGQLRLGVGMPASVLG